MRNFFLSLFICCAQTAFSQGLVLSGSMPGLANKNLSISNLDHPVAQIPVDSVGKFNSTLLLDAGYYMFDNIKRAVYLEPGMQLVIDRSGNTLRFSGKGSDENNMIASMDNFAKSILPAVNGYLVDSAYLMAPDELMKKIVVYEISAAKILSTAMLSNDFKKLQAEDIRYYTKTVMHQYRSVYGIDPLKRNFAQSVLKEVLSSRRPGQPTDSTLMARYNEATKNSKVKHLSAADSARFNGLKDFNPNSELAYKASGYYRSLLGQYVADKRAPMGKSTGTKMSYTDILNSVISNVFIKDNLLYQHTIQALKFSKGDGAPYQEYMSSSKNERYKNDMASMFSQFNKSKGMLPPTFSFEDASGRKVSLSTFKGNYVFIDIWASWCLPCMRDLPYLKDLAAKFSGKKISFVSLSVDSKIDDWKKVLKDLQPEGAQLRTNGMNSTFLQFFNVSTIPRYIILDLDGKVVNDNAPGPNNVKLLAQLNKLLE